MSDKIVKDNTIKNKPKKYKNLIAQLTKPSNPEDKQKTEKENLAKSLGGGEFTKLVKI